MRRSEKEIINILENFIGKDLDWTYIENELNLDNPLFIYPAYKENYDEYGECKCLEFLEDTGEDEEVNNTFKIIITNDNVIVDVF